MKNCRLYRIWNKIIDIDTFVNNYNTFSFHLKLSVAVWKCYKIDRKVKKVSKIREAG